MDSTITIHSVTLPCESITLTADDKRDISSAYAEWREAQEGDSNDAEIDAAGELIDTLLHILGAKTSEEEIPQCDECDEPATVFWPNLAPPVQMCESCAHDAFRSGWEPGQ